jgi:hypothetical protein
VAQRKGDQKINQHRKIPGSLPIQGNTYLWNDVQRVIVSF